MPRPQFFGYQRCSNDSVVITQGCRPVASVHGSERVRMLLAELGEDDAQQVLARWSAAAAPRPVDAPGPVLHGRAVPAAGAGLTAAASGRD
jgi:hypothetical protein